MNRIWIAAALFALTVAAGILALSSTVRHAAEMESLLSQSEEEAYDNNLEAAAIKLQEIETLWDEKSPLIMMYVNHLRTEGFKLELSQMKMALKKSDQNEFLMSAARARTILECMQSDETPTWVNVF